MNKDKARTPNLFLPKVLQKVESMVAGEKVSFIDTPGKIASKLSAITTAVILQNRNRPKNYLLSLIATTLNDLESGARILLISHKGWGAKSLVNLFAQHNFSTQIDTIFTGFEGYRIVEIIKTHDNVSFEYTQNHSFKEKINNKFSGEFEFEFVTSDQLFSYKHLDEGTRAIIENTDFSKVSTIMDFGCGWGAIGIFAHLINPKARIFMIDENKVARDIVTQNIQRAGKSDSFVVAGLKDIGNQKIDLIVSYPPFHVSNISVNQIVLDLKNFIHPKSRIIFCTDDTFLSKYKIALEAIFEQSPSVRKVGQFNILTVIC